MHWSIRSTLALTAAGGLCLAAAVPAVAAAAVPAAAPAMDYYDGNTVTGLWNYAQHFAMSDNFFDTEFGPSTPGALNLISGQTANGTSVNAQGVPEPDPGAIGSQNSTTDGPRLPFLLISPFAKKDYVSNSLADQTSILASSRTTGSPGSARVRLRSTTSRDR